MNKTDQIKNPESFICPRCEGLIPSNEHWGEYIGAISRATLPDEESIEVCSACGTEEALEDFAGFLTQPIHFPKMDEASLERRFQAMMIIERHNE